MPKPGLAIPHTSNLQLAILACGNGSCCRASSSANTECPLVSNHHWFSCAETYGTAETQHGTQHMPCIVPSQTEQSVSERCLMTCHTHKMMLQKLHTRNKLPVDDCPTDL